MQNLNANQLFEPLQWPNFTAVEHHPNALQLQFTIPTRLEYFAGHFPDQAVLPGVVQLHWAGELARQYFQLTGFSNAKNVKFNSPLLPAMSASLSLTNAVDFNAVEFRYFDEENHYSSGKLEFGA